MPTQPLSTAADLVIDTFGTFLGKRSERLVVRWREPQVKAGETHEMAGPTSDDDGPGILQFPQPRTVAADESGSVETATPVDEPTGAAAARELLSFWRKQGRAIPQDPPPKRNRFAELDGRLEEFSAEKTGDPRGEWREREVPLVHVRSLVVSGRGVTVSSDLIEVLVQRGIILSFLNGRGMPLANVTTPGVQATVLTRRAQLAAYSTALGLEFAVSFIEGKLRNQRHTLLYFAKYLKQADPERYALVRRKAAMIGRMRDQLARVLVETDPATENPLDDQRERLMGTEGSGARVYWEGVAAILKGKVDFPGRHTRGALDPVNAALNYGYGILYSQVFGAVTNAGLEPFAGFLHVDRPGKPSLVLDLVEEFRAPVVDRAILALVNQGVSLETDAHGLVAASRREVAERVTERLNKPVPYEGKRHRLRHVIQMQARHIATAIRGERQYRPYASRW